jgi:uncharacterized protein (DUF2384 family)
MMVENMSSAAAPSPERQLELEKLIQRVTGVYGSSNRALAWLQTTNPALGGRTPMQVYKVDGVQPIEELLIAIEHGTVT